MLARIVSYLLVVSVFLFAGPAAAQVKNRAKAQAHYEAAEKAYQKAEFRKALDDYLKVLDFIERDSIPEMYFNIAQCHRQLGEVEKALFYYRLFLSKSPTSPLRPEVEKHLAALEAERQKTAKPKGKVTIITEPPGATILIDTFEGEGVGITPRVLEVEIGTHILVLRLANHKDITHQLVVEAEKMVVVQHTMVPASGAAPVKTEDAKSLLTQDDTKKPPVGADPVPGTPQPVPFYGRWWFWTGVGATAVFAIATGYFGMETLSLKDKWNETGEGKYKNDGENARLFTDLFLGATVISAGLTIWGALSVGDGTSGLPKQPEKGSAWLLPSCGDAGCGFVFQYNF